MLSQERQKIDAIDRQMVALFEERMTAVENIIAIKKIQGLPVLDQGREDAVISKVQSYLSKPELADDIAHIYREIMRLSRAFQSKQ